MILSRRFFVAFALALLVVGVQYGSQLHALEHLGDALSHAKDQSFGKAAANDVCAICALFAGGANAIAGDHDEQALDFATRTTPQFAPASIAKPAPSYYSSRAPPSLL